MPTSPKIFKPSVRKRKAYYTALQVFLSYYWLRWKSKIFGKKYYKNKILKLHLKNAQRIESRVKELQGLFIKFAQLISNLSNVLPPEFREPLESLQDQVPARNISEISESIKTELGKNYQDIFSSFNEQALAAASIGQAHKAVYQGQDVVVKIQHQNIETIAAADLEILLNLIKLHAFFMDMQGLDHTYEQVRQMIEQELDYQQEAESMQELSQLLQKTPELNIVIPKVFKELSTKKILVTAFQEGVKVNNIKQLQAWNLDTNELAKRLLELYCEMVLVHGFYHADPHPGNILVNQEGQIILLDFGATARIQQSTKEAIPELIEALAKNNTEETTLALRKLGFLGDDKHSKKFVDKLINIAKEFIETEVELDGLNFQNIKVKAGMSSMLSLLAKIDLREVSSTIRIPKEYILLNRTTILLLGNCFLLAPNLNPLKVVRPYIKKNILNESESLTQIIVRTFKNQLTTAVSLPADLSKFLKQNQESEFEENLSDLLLQSKQNNLLLTRIFYLLLVLASVYFLERNFWSIQGVFSGLLWALLAFSTLALLKSFFASAKK